MNKDIKTGAIVAFVIIAIWWLYCVLIYKNSQDRLDGIALTAYKTFNSGQTLTDTLDLTSINFVNGNMLFKLSQTIPGKTNPIVFSSGLPGVSPGKPMSAIYPLLTTYINSNVIKNGHITLAPSDTYLPPEETNATFWEAVGTVVDGNTMKTTIWLSNAVTLERYLFCNVTFVMPCADGDQLNCADI